MSAQSVLPAYGMNRPSFPRMYETSIVGPIFRPWAELLLERARLAPNIRVLDVATGTGIVARLAWRRLQGTGTVVGVDVSAPMLEVAREIEPDIDWREGDAAALPVSSEEQFDRVLCQQGIQFFADRPAAARELRRVTAPNGVLVAAVWRSAEEMPAFQTLQRVAERYVGPIDDQRYALGDADVLRRLVSDAGFRDVQVTEASLVSTFTDGRGFVRMNAMALIGMSSDRSSDEQRERLIEEMTTESMVAVKAFLDGASLKCEMRSNIIVGNAKMGG